MVASKVEKMFHYIKLANILFEIYLFDCLFIRLSDYVFIYFTHNNIQQ